MIHYRSWVDHLVVLSMVEILSLEEWVAPAGWIDTNRILELLGFWNNSSYISTDV